MCGIAGIYHLDQRPVSLTQLKKMAQAIAHRGPDDEGIWTNGNIGLAHRRLSIRDISTAGHQPMLDETEKFCVSFNGEIYNDTRLKESLHKEHGIRFTTGCDTEVLPYGFRHWKSNLFSKLEGIFAFAIWDENTKQLTLVRDPAGTKPLFYYQTDDSLYFASEIKAILAALDKPPAIVPEHLHSFLAQGYVSPRETMLENMHQVPPGTALTFRQDGSCQHITYYTMKRRGGIHSMDQAVEEFMPLWDTVLSDQLVSDVPVGILQSGGIDSTLVSYGLRKHKSVPLFTAGFRERSHDESDLAALVAKDTGHTLHVFDSQKDENAGEILRNVVKAFDGQVADASAYAFYQLAEQVRQKVTVALSGDGADELFGGYSTYQASSMTGFLAAITIPPLARSVGRVCYRLAAKNEGRLPMADLAFRFALGLANGKQEAHAHWRCLVPDFLRDSIYDNAMNDVRSLDPFAHYAEAMRNASGSDLLDRCLLADQSYHLPAGLLMKTDAMSMAHALEVRVPFLNTRIVDFASRCDLSLLTSWRGPGKKILRSTLERYNAPQAVTTGKKRGFNVPIAQLLRGPLNNTAEEYLHQKADLLAPYLKPDAVCQLWHEHKNQKANHAYALWPILTFSIWRETMA